MSKQQQPQPEIIHIGRFCTSLICANVKIGEKRYEHVMSKSGENMGTEVVYKTKVYRLTRRRRVKQNGKVNNVIQALISVEARRRGWVV